MGEQTAEENLSPKITMRVVINGATGFIGRALSDYLLGADYEVVALVRNPGKGKTVLGDRVTLIAVDGTNAHGWRDAVEGSYALINLAGENISSGRWTEEKKRRILESRLRAGKAVVETLRQTKRKPEVLVQASAIGYYGPRLDELLDESSSYGRGFLSRVVQEWEASTTEVESLGVRRIVIRTGLVLGRTGGALPRFLLPFRLFLGGPIGSGKQWLSWIHLQDELKAIRFLMEHKDLQGVFNLTAPEPLRMKDFSRLMGKAMGRPSWLQAPGFALRLLWGEMAEEMLLSGQRVVPKRLLGATHSFLYPNAESALRDLLVMNEKAA